MQFNEENAIKAMLANKPKFILHVIHFADQVTLQKKIIVYIIIEYITL
jgi:hypothetical protein